MSNRLLKLKGKKKSLAAFITGGDPDIQTTENIVLAMEESGVDLVQIGIPFSDPIAENIVMQEADKRALEGGCTVDKLFDMVVRLREKTNIPLVFVTYANPVYAYGKNSFITKCQKVGIDGIIVPDVPFEEKAEFAEDCNRHNIYLISLISPSTEERTAKIAADAKGFLYCVSALNGADSDMRASISAMISQAKRITDIPCFVGFGVSTPQQAHDMASISDGVIVSSAFVQLIAEHGKNGITNVKSLVYDIKNSIG